MYVCVGDRKAVEHLILGDDAQQQIDCLKGEFAEIALEASKCLKEKHDDAEIAGKWINEVLRGTQHESLMVCSGVTASTHDDLFKHLQTKWSFTNPDNLERLIRKLPTAPCSLREKIRGYKKKFRDFCHSLSLDGNTQMRFEVLDSDKPCLIIETKAIELDFDEIFAFLDDVFEIYKRYFRVHKIEPGCIKVTLQFPDDMKQLIQACINQKCDYLKQYAISMHVLEPQKMQDQKNPSGDDSNQDESTQTEKGNPSSKNSQTSASKSEKDHNFSPPLTSGTSIPCFKVEDKSDLSHQIDTHHELSNEGTLGSMDYLTAGTGDCHTSDYSSGNSDFEEESSPQPQENYM